MTLEKFEKKEKDILYKLWNRMSSGSYFPSAVKRVEIPKKSGGTRSLGIPTVVDRVAQMTARLYLEPILEPNFHPDSYGYRPRKSAHQALEVTRNRCWKYDWIIDLDIKGFFDNIDHELMMKAVDFHKPPAWVRLYIERWLKAPAKDFEGTVIRRSMGTPQGGVISPLLANLFLHYAFDQWITRNHPGNPFARYADDLVVHCRSYEEAIKLLEEIKVRLDECKLTVHPEKTKIIFCKDDNRKGDYKEKTFDFLGFTFRPRLAKNKRNQYFVSFSPAISKKAQSGIYGKIRSMKMQSCTGCEIEDMAKLLNPSVRGWLNYYGIFRKSALGRICEKIQINLVKWAKNKFRKLKNSWVRAFDFMRALQLSKPKLFVHWEWGFN
jgi:RNA-directed DNA polymerase